MSGHWREAALCAEVDMDLWFPEKGHNATAAKRVCFRCPVRTECLAFALDTRQQHGVWGGVVFRQRVDMRRRTEQEAS